MFFINMSIPLSLWTRVFCGYFNNESKSKTKEIKVNYPIDLTDQLGRQVKVDNKPERIVSLAPANTEIIYTLGTEDRLTGVTEYCDYPVVAKSKDKVGGYSTVDIEKIKNKNPDLILAASIHLKEVIPELEKLGFTILALEPKSPHEMLGAISLIGECIGNPEEAAVIVKGLKSRLDSVEEKIKTLKKEQKPRVFYIHEHETWKTFGSGTIGDTLTELAGGINIGREFGEYYPYPKVKEVIEKNPDVIIVETGYGKNVDEPLDAALKDERLTGMDARKNGRVYGINSDYISRTGPRIIDGLEILAKLLHPKLFYSNK